MSDTSSPIRIETGDLYSPQVNEFVEMQQALRRDTEPIDPQPLIIRVIYSSWFYLSIASGLGALAGWALVEPYYTRGEKGQFNHDQLLLALVDYLFFVTVAAGVGLFLGAAEGLMCRNIRRASLCGLVGA